MKQQIALITNYLPDQQESMIQFGEAMRELLDQHLDCQIRWQPIQFFHRLSFAFPEKFSKWLAYLDKFVLGVVSLALFRLRHPGVIWHIVDHGNAIYAFVLPASRVLITCHDCIAIEDAFFGRRQQNVGLLGPILQRGISSGLRRAAVVVCDTKTTADDLLRLVAPNPKVLQIVHLGMVQKLPVPPHSSALRLLQAAGIDTNRPFIFMIGSDLKRKNRVNTIKCFNILRSSLTEASFQLVFAGKPLGRDTGAMVNASPWRNDIIFAGRLDNSTLAAAYRHASVVMFPSLAEGFGLPIVEAQSCEAVLVTSSRLPMTEIAGEGAIYIDPEDPVDMAEGVLRAIERSDTLRRVGVHNAGRFTPERMLSGYLDAYRSLGSST